MPETHEVPDLWLAAKQREAEEEARMVAQNVQSAAATEQAIAEYEASELSLARRQQLHSEWLMRLPSDESQAWMDANGAQREEVLAAMEGRENWTPEEVVELVDTLGLRDEVTKLLT